MGVNPLCFSILECNSTAIIGNIAVVTFVYYIFVYYTVILYYVIIRLCLYTIIVAGIDRLDLSADCRGRCLVGPVNSTIALNFLSLYNNNLNFISVRLVPYLRQVHI